MAKIKEWDYIFLKWLDSCWWAWWIHREEEHIPWVSTIDTVWIVFKITKQYITIIQSKELNWDSIDNYINIPLIAVCKKKILK